VRFLAGGDVNVSDDDGDTPLYTVENVQTARFLVENGAIVARQNLEGVSVCIPLPCILLRRMAWLNFISQAHWSSDGRISGCSRLFALYSWFIDIRYAGRKWDAYATAIAVFTKQCVWGTHHEPYEYSTTNHPVCRGRRKGSGRGTQIGGEQDGTGGNFHWVWNDHNWGWATKWHAREAFQDQLDVITCFVSFVYWLMIVPTWSRSLQAVDDHDLKDLHRSSSLSSPSCRLPDVYQ